MTRLRLDLLAVEVCTTLAEHAVPYALIKGPTTSLWLYDPPRPYRDVDVLVPHSQVDLAAAALADAGVAVSQAGKVGEEASHSLLMHAAAGFEIDLHVSLPATPTSGDRVWQVLESHREAFHLDVGEVVSLDAVGRCLVLALHAVDNPSPSQPATDLLLARGRCEPEVWESVERLADQIGVLDLVDAAIAVAEDREVAVSRRAWLHMSGAPGAALGLQRLMDAPRRELARRLWGELVPTKGFMAHAEGDAALRRTALVRAHARRWRRLARQLPTAARAFRDSPRDSTQPYSWRRHDDDRG